MSRALMTIPATTTAALALLLAGCGIPDVEDTVTDLAEDAAAADEDTDETEDDGDEGDEEDGTVETEIGGVYEFSDGLSVELSNVHRGVSGEWAFPEATPYVGFTVQVQNATGDAVDLVLFHVECAIGEDGRRAESIFDSENGLGDGFTSTVMDGNNATMDWGCELPEDDSAVQIEISVNDDLLTRPTVYFVGDVD